MTKKENLLKGFIKENPLFVSVLGTCPALGITTKLENALGMGLAILFVLVLSNLIISLIASWKWLSEAIEKVRIPVYIIVIATLVTIVDMLMQAYLGALSATLGVFIPLIVVNCVILGRAEAFASKNKPLDSVIDGVSMALGYTLAIGVIALVREVLGTGTITVWGSLSFDVSVIFTALGMTPNAMFTSSAGAFLTLGFVLAGIAALQNVANNKKKEEVSK